jgi:hypothetical protein
VTFPGNPAGRGDPFQRRDQIRGRLKPRVRRFLEEPPDGLCAIRQHVGLLLQHRGRGFVKDRVERIHGELARERALAGEHLEQHRAQREQVCATVDLAAPDLLGREVPGRPEQHAGHGRTSLGCGVAVRELGDPEVQDLPAARTLSATSRRSRSSVAR